MSQLQTFSNAPVKESSIIGTNRVNPKGDSLEDFKGVAIDPRDNGDYRRDYDGHEGGKWRIWRP